MLRRLALHFPRRSPEPLQEQVVEVPSHAVDRQDAQVVDMEVPIRMGQADLGGIDLVQPVDLADLRGYVVVQSLERVGHVGVLIDLPV